MCNFTRVTPGVIWTHLSLSLYIYIYIYIYIYGGEKYREKSNQIYINKKFNLKQSITSEYII